ncbi:MAG: hypothetical protein RI922_624 [Bacteroidota bacterium]|jgi:serine phosphatase RsbU (regulator of sigma subunit)
MLAELKKPQEADLTTYIESLNYAQIIQHGLLPKKRHFKRLFEDYFVIYKPLNILSGDFYWIGKKDHLTYFAVGDCTGHGVPGALLSVLASSILEYSIMNKGLNKTNKILQEVDKKFIESFSGSKEDFFNNDWVDIALVCIDNKENKIYFSSANRKICIVNSKAEIDVLAGSPYPIGGWQVEQHRKFESRSYAFKKGDCLYIGSDGFQDQIGGPKNKKYSSKRLHELFGQIGEKGMSDQESLLENEFMDWKGANDQIDDVCIVGIRL